MKRFCLKKEREFKQSNHIYPWYTYSSNVDGLFVQFDCFKNSLCEMHGCATNICCPNEMGYDNGLERKSKIQGSGLTWSIIKYANEPVVRIIREEVKDLVIKGINKNINKTTLKYLLNGVFIYFLRLQCPIDNTIWHIQKVESRLIEGRIIEAETFLEYRSSLFTERFSKEYDSQFWITVSKWEDK